MSDSLRATRGRSARTVIAVGGAVEKVRMNVKGGLLESEKVEGAEESVAVILGVAGGKVRVVKVMSLSPTRIQAILVDDGVGMFPADRSGPGPGDRVSNDSSFVDGQCVMESV